MRNPKVYVKFVSIVYVLLCINEDIVLDVQVIPVHCLRTFLS
jgi:hypothetical protein